MSAGLRALLGALDRGDNLLGDVCRAVDGSDVEDVVVDGDTVGLFAFDQHHADRRRCHRHTQYDVHSTPPNVCCSLVVIRAHLRTVSRQLVLHRRELLLRYIGRC